MAERVLGSLESKRVGVIGTGEIGRVAAEHFGSIQPKELLLFNRTSSKAELLAESLKSEGISVRVVPNALEIFSTCDVIVSCVSSAIFEDTHLQKALSSKNSCFVLDLAVPPTLPDSLSELVYFYKVDDLKRISDENNKLRQQELLKASEIIENELGKSRAQIEALDLQETFLRLSEKVDELRKSELQALRAKVNDVSDSNWLEVEKMSQRLAAKILQDPMRELRTRLERDAEKDSFLQFFRNLFRI
jgi:glutamyl-tRNA reductase